MDRREYIQTARIIAKRGAELPQSKLTEADVRGILAARDERVRLRQMINDRLSNAALAAQYGVHPRTIEKVLDRETWVRVHGKK